MVMTQIGAMITVAATSASAAAHSHAPPQRAAATIMALAKAAEGKLVVIDSTEIKSPKTSEVAKSLNKLGWASVLLIDGEKVNDNFAKAVRNIPCVDVLPQQGANVYDIMRRDTLVLTKDAVAALEARLK